MTKCLNGQNVAGMPATWIKHQYGSKTGSKIEDKGGHIERLYVVMEC